MKRLLQKVENRTEEVLKKHCEEWLSTEVTTLEKAFPYLPSTLMALLAAKIQDTESAGKVLTFLEENNYNGKWAQKPEELLEKWMNESKDIVPVLERSFEFIMGKYRDTVFEQLQSTGDLKVWQLKRLLPFLSAILLSSLAEWESEEQADQKDLMLFIKEHYEEVKRSTPSKLMEILKQEANFENIDITESGEEDGEKEPPAPALRKTIPFFIGIIMISGILIWLNTDKKADEAEKQKLEEQASQEDVNHKIWQLNDDIELKLENDDPMNKLVERLVGLASDSINTFYLKNVPWQDTLMPQYYRSTIDHLQTIHRAFPDAYFHLNIQVVKQEKSKSEFSVGKRLKSILSYEMPNLLSSNTVTYSIDLSKTDTWSPNLSKELVLHAEMKWVITIKR